LRGLVEGRGDAAPEDGTRRLLRRRPTGEEQDRRGRGLADRPAPLRPPDEGFGPDPTSLPGGNLPGGGPAGSDASRPDREIGGGSPDQDPTRLTAPHTRENTRAAQNSRRARPISVRASMPKQRRTKRRPDGPHRSCSTEPVQALR